MKNITVEVQGDTLILKVNLKKTFGPSSSGKTTIIASSEGNQSVPDHPEIKFGLNVYTK